MSKGKGLERVKVGDLGKRAAPGVRARFQMPHRFPLFEPVVYGAARHAKRFVRRHLAHPTIYGSHHAQAKVLAIRGTHNIKCSLSLLDDYMVSTRFSVSSA